uniref:Ribonuclease H-like domain-containing protein n=1 Tax=Tanacetum cinerariifolium TaxID=118510 RepID=A0A6L2KE45_TANCI|nr:ribonuclease H-like domain-containing protein [Tanacetum cinerariifolium]
MSAPNSVYNTPVNSEHGDDYVEDPDPITRIRKNKIGFIDGSCKRSNTDEVLGRQWDRGFEKHNQLTKLMQFLMGLDDSYMQIRSSILSRKVLPDVRSAHATISCEESYRVASSSFFGSSQRSQASAFVSNVPNRRANQHTTYTDKDLDNVLDISHLKIKVGHPNRTEAFISKIENLRLPSFVLSGKSFYEMIYKKCPSLSHLRCLDVCVLLPLSILVKSLEADLKTSKFPHWIDAMNQEMNALHRNGTWDIVELHDRKAIGSKWIYKIKYQSSGVIDRFKARLVA